MQDELDLDTLIENEINKKEKQRKLRLLKEEYDRETNEIIQETERVSQVAHNSRKILKNLNNEFESYTGLTAFDVKILFIAVGMQMVRQYALTQFPNRLDDQTAAKNTFGHTEEHSNRDHDYYNPTLEEIISNPVPFDANIGSNGALAGVGSMGHRVAAIGHDPLLGLVFGTANIATSTLTTNRLESYHIKTNEYKRDYFEATADTALVLSYTGDKLLNQGINGKIIVATSLEKEIIHLSSDLNTTHSLPLPVVSVIDGKMASSLAERGLDMANVVNVGKQATFSLMINTLIAMYHGLFYDGSVNRDLYEVRTRKIITYSNVIASGSNLLLTGAKSLISKKAALKTMDLGGLMVTIYRLMDDQEFISQIKQEFIEREFFNLIRGTEFSFS